MTSPLKCFTFDDGILGLFLISNMQENNGEL